MRRAHPSAVVLLGLAAVAAAARPAAGQQETTLVQVEVRQVAGSNVYLDLGTDAGLATGDTLQVKRTREGPVVGRLVVVAATAVRSVLTFAEGTFPLASGETVILGLLRPPSAGVEGAVTPAVAGEPAGTRPVRASRPAAHGRITAEVGVNSSRTTMGLVAREEVSRTFATPALRIDLTVPEAVGGFTFRARSRVSHRYSPDYDFTRPTSAQVYDLRLERRFESAPVRLTLGRFYSPAESFSGFWDGVALRLGEPGFGGGFLVGFEPDFWNQEPTLDFPKATVFVDYDRAGPGWRWSGDLSAHVVAPRPEGLERHLFFGVGQRIDVGALRVQGEAQLDRHPTEGGVRVSEAVVRTTVAISPALSIRFGGARYERYALFGVTDPFGPRRDRVGGGLTLRIGNLRLSADHTLNRYPGGRERQSSTGAISLARLPGLPGLGWSATSTYWSGEVDDALTLGSSLSFRLASARVRVGYRFQQVTSLDRERVLHSPDAWVSVPVSSGLTLVLRTRGQWGDQLTGQYFHLALQRAF